MIIPTIDMAATGSNISRLRINAGLSVKELADIFGFATPQAVYKWQHGVAMPTLDNLVVLAAVFGVCLIPFISEIFLLYPKQGMRKRNNFPFISETSGVKQGFEFSFYIANKE